jgi:hypothetical protein
VSQSATSVLKRLVSEPLLHFVLIGAVLFYIGGQKTPEGGVGRNEIVITEGDIDQLLVAWQVQGLPPPSAAAIRGMVEGKVREEVLYREAMGMGLDQGDVIVKRRLAQKMDFLAEDLSALQEPTKEELRTWFEAHREEFAQPPRISFRHVYYSFDTYGAKAQEAAAQQVSAVTGPENGDRFMFQNSYAERTEAELLAIFGPAFAREVFTLDPGHWVGPVHSGYGWHAVFIERKTPPIVPGFQEVEADVKAVWLAARRAEFREEAYRVMRGKYKVVLPTFDEPGPKPDSSERKQAGGEAS